MEHLVVKTVVNNLVFGVVFDIASIPNIKYNSFFSINVEPVLLNGHGMMERYSVTIQQDHR